MKQLRFYLTISYFTFALLSCKKMLTLDSPPTQLTDDKVFSSDETIIAALNNIYASLNTADVTHHLPTAIYADDISYFGTDPSTRQFADNTVTPTTASIGNTWRNYYNIIYQCNLLLEGLNQSANGVTEATKLRCKGEAIFLRCWSYYLLTNLFGDVPLILSTDVNNTAISPRAPISAIYAQLILDLKEAISLLPITYATTEKVTANKCAAQALLSRLFVLTENWQEVVTYTNAVINSGIYILESPSAVFVKNSKEAIFQQWQQNGFTSLGTALIPSSGIPLYRISTSLLQAFSSNDLRLPAWTKTVSINGQPYVHAFKYKNRTTTTSVAGEYTMHLRLAELYLSNAEAYAHLNLINEATNRLTILRQRAGLVSVQPSISQDSCIKLCLEERRLELFSENGHRFFDLKRTKKIDSVLAAIKPNWKPVKSVFPIPQNELLNNPRLYQNPGY